MDFECIGLVDNISDVTFLIDNYYSLVLSSSLISFAIESFFHNY